jgi:hypothetical protein
MMKQPIQMSKRLPTTPSLPGLPESPPMKMWIRLPWKRDGQLERRENSEPIDFRKINKKNK